MKEEISTLRIRDFPQLSFICWSLDKDACILESEAFAIYERNWRFVDQTALSPEEAHLIERLKNEYGNGFLLV